MLVLETADSRCVRSRRMRLTMLLAAAWFAGHLDAQQAVLRGDVHVPTGYPGELRVELVEMTGVPVGVSGPVNSDGSFELRYAPYGAMVLRLTDAYGRSIRDEHIDVNANTPPISIRLPERRVERPGAGTVSMRRLRNPPTKKAVKLFAEAQKHSERSNYEKAARALEQAIRISPDFVEARTNLGVQYIRLGNPQGAAAQMQEAAAIDPDSDAVWSNLAVALLMLERSDEAEAAARKALALSPNQPKAQYLLGSALLARPGSAAEGMQWLKRAAPEFPPARATLQALDRRQTR